MNTPSPGRDPSGFLRKSKSKVSFASHENINAREPERIKLRKPLAEEKYSIDSESGTDAMIEVDGKIKTCRKNSEEEVVLQPLSSSISLNMVPEETSVSTASGIPWAGTKNREILLGVQHLDPKPTNEQVPLAPQRRVHSFNSLVPLHGIKVPELYSSLSLDYPEYCLLANGEHQRPSIPTASFKCLNMKQRGIEWAKKNSPITDNFELDECFQGYSKSLESEEKHPAIPARKRITSWPSTPQILATEAEVTAVNLTENQPSMKSKLEGRSVCFNNTVEEVIFLDYPDHQMESSFASSDSTSSTCSGSDED